MITAVLWDLGDVLCGFHPERRVAALASASGRSQDDVRAFLAPELLQSLDRGELDAGGLLRLARRDLDWQGSSTELGRAWVTAFQPDRVVLELVSRTLPIASAVLTDNGPPLSDGYATLLPDVAKVLPMALFSAHAGKTKPDPALFRWACEKMDRSFDEVLLVDDRPANVSAAARLGMAWHRFDGAVGLERALVDIGLL